MRMAMYATAAAIMALCMAAAGGEAAAHTAPDTRTFQSATPSELLEPWWRANPTLAGVAGGSAGGVPNAAEAASLTINSQRSLLNGTADVTRVRLSTGGGPSHNAIGDDAPPARQAAWTFIEGGPNDVVSDSQGACRVVGGVELEIREIFSHRGGATMFIVHDALSSNDARMHMIYHPGAQPAVPHTAPNTRICEYVADRITTPGEAIRTIPATPAGTAAAHTALLSFEQDIAIAGTRSSLAGNVGFYYGNQCGPDVISGCDIDLAGTSSLDTVGPFPDRSYLVPIPAGSNGRTALDSAGTGPLPEFFGVTWNQNSQHFFQKVSDSSNIGVPSPRAIPVRDALPPVPDGAVGGAGTTSSPYTQAFSEALVGDVASVFEGVKIVKTAIDGTSTEVTDALVTGISGSTVSFTSSSAAFAATDHVEYIGIFDAAGSTSIKPRIVSIEPVDGSTTTTTVRLNIPVTGTTEAGHWFVSSSAAGEPRARAVAVAPGIVADPTDDASGTTDVAVTYSSLFTLEHASIAEASTLSVEYVPTATHTSLSDRFDGRLGAAGLRVEAAGPIGESAVVRPDARYSAATQSTATTLVTFSAALAGDVDIDNWTITDSDTATTARAVTSIALGTGESAPTATTGNAHTIADGSAETTLLIRHAELASTGSTPSVTYTAGALTAGGDDVTGDAIEAADGVDPVFSAQVNDGAQVVVTLSEPVTQVDPNPSDTRPTSFDFAYHTKAGTGYAFPAGVINRIASGVDLDASVWPTSNTFDATARTATLQFGGALSADIRNAEGGSPVHYCRDRAECLAAVEDGDEVLLTSTPTIVFTYYGTAYQDAAGNRMANILNTTRVTAVATDNASPVAFAAFEDATTIRVRFSEPMVSPSAAVLGNVAVTGPGSPAVSGTPMFTAHTDATATARFVQPSLAITLSSAASTGDYTVSLPGFSAASGPSGKLSVANTMASYTAPDTAAPLATAISVVVHDGSPGTNTAKTGDNSGFAGVGDTVRIEVTLDEANSGTPTIDVGGLTGESMTRVTSGDDTAWRYDLAVVSSTTEAASLDFTMSVSDAVPNTGTVTATTGHSGTITVARPAIDTTAPALHATTVPVFSGTDLRVTFTEAIAIPTPFTVTVTLDDRSTTQTVSATASGAVLTVPFGTHASATGTYSAAIPTTLTDRAGNAVAASTTASATYTAPVVEAPGPTFTASVFNTTAVTIMFSAPLTGTTTTANWSIGEFRAVEMGLTEILPGEFNPVEDVKVDLSSSAGPVYIRTNGLWDRDRAQPEVIYTPPTSNAPADSDGVALPMRTVTASNDRAPAPPSPGFSAAQLDSARQVTATMSAAVTGTITGSEWNIGSGVTFDGGSASGSTITLTLDEANALPSTAVDLSTRLAYTGSSSVMVGGAALAAGSVSLTDAASPTFRAVSSGNANMTLAAVIFSEPVSGSVATTQWEVNDTVYTRLHTDPTHTESFVTTLTLNNDFVLVLSPIDGNAPYPVGEAAAGASVEFTKPSPATLVDAAGNEVESATVTTVDDTTAPTFSARALSPTTTAIDFGELVYVDGNGENPLSGTSPSWRVGGVEPTAVASATRLGAAEITLTHAEVTSPYAVEYTAASESILLDFSRNVLAAGTVTISDSLVILSAALTSSRTMDVTISEAVTGTTVASEWGLSNGATFASADLSADGLTVTLTSAEDIFSSTPTAVPTSPAVTLSYTGSTLANMDSPPMPLPAASAVRLVDEAPPEVDWMFMRAGYSMSPADSMQGVGQTSVSAGSTWFSDTVPGARVGVLAGFTEPFSGVTTSDITFLSRTAGVTSASATRSSGGTIYNATYFIPGDASHTGPIRFDMDVRDEAGNSATYTEADLTGHSVGLVAASTALDVANAGFYDDKNDRTDDNTSIEIRFNRPLNIGTTGSGTLSSPGNAADSGMIDVAAGTDAAVSRNYDFFAAGILVHLGAPAVEGTTYTVTVPGTWTTRGGGSVSTADSQPISVPVTYDATAPTIDASATLNTDGTITATFSEALRESSVETPRQYAVDEPARAFTISGTGVTAGTTLAAEWTGGSTNAVTLTPSQPITTSGSTITASTAVQDANGVAIAAGQTATVGQLASTVTFTAAFRDPLTIVLTFDAALDADTVIPANFALSAPDNTNIPHDDDTDRDVIALEIADAGATPPVVPAAYDAGPPATVTLTLIAPAAIGIEHTIAPTSSLQDADGASYNTDLPPQPATYSVAETVPPRITAAQLDNDRTVTVTMSENVRGPVLGAQWNIGPGITFASGSITGSTVTLMRAEGDELSTAVAPGTVLTYTGDGSITDAAGNELAAGAAIALVDAAPPSFRVLAVNSTLAAVYFSEPVSGAISRTEWAFDKTVDGSPRSETAQDRIFNNFQGLYNNLGAVTSMDNDEMFFITLSRGLSGFVGGSIFSNPPIDTVTFTPPTTPTLRDALNMPVAAASLAPTTDDTLPTFTAYTTSATETVIQFSEVVVLGSFDGRTRGFSHGDFYEHWTVGGMSVTASSAVEASYPVRTQEVTLTHGALGTRTPSVVFDGVQDYRHEENFTLSDDAKNQMIDATVIATDGPPAMAAEAQFEAATQSRTTTLVSFDAALGGTIDTSDWTITDGRTARAISSIALGTASGAPTATPDSDHTIGASSTATGLLITHARLSSSTATPTVAYAPGALTEAGGPVAAGSARATDGAPPELIEARFASDRAITATFSEALSSPSSVTFEVHLTATDATPRTTGTGSSTLADSALGGPDSVITVNLAAIIQLEREFHVDFSGVADAGGAVYTSDTRTPITFGPQPTLDSATLESATRTVVTLSAAVTGMTEAGDWVIDVDTTDSSELRATGVASGDVSTVAATDGPVAITSDTITLLHPRISTGATPTITYEPISAARLDLSDVPLAPDTTGVVATDSAPPTVLRAQFSDTDTIAVTFSEAVADPSSLTFSLYEAATGGTAVSSTGTPARSMSNTVVTFDVATAVSTEQVYHLVLTGVADLAPTPNSYTFTARQPATYDTSAPTASGAAFAGTKVINVTFDDELDASGGFTAANFVVTVPDNTLKPDDDGTEADVIALDSENPVSYDASAMRVSLLLADLALDGITYTVTPTSVDNIAGVAYAATTQPTATYNAPFTATTVSDGIVSMVFATGAAGTVRASEITIVDSDEAMTSLPVEGVGTSFTFADDVTLPTDREIFVGTETTASFASGASTPTITYTAPATGAVTISSTAVPVGEWIAVAADEIQPNSSSAALDADGRRIVIQWNEPIDPDFSGSNEYLRLQVPVGSSHHTVRDLPNSAITTEGFSLIGAIEPRLKSGTYRLQMQVSDLAGNSAEQDREFFHSSPAPEISSMLTTSTRTTVITLEEPTSGTLRISDWEVDDGTETTPSIKAIQSVRVGVHTSAEVPSSYATTATLASGTQFTLTHEALGSEDSAPYVAFTRPTSLSSTQSALVNAAGEALESDPAGTEQRRQAADGIGAIGASALTVTVADDIAGTFTDRTGANAHVATIGDRVTIGVTFDADVDASPTISVPGAARTPIPTPMGNAGDTNDRTWSHSFVISALDDSAPLEFTITAADASAMTGALLTQNDITAGRNAEFDASGPSLSATTAPFFELTTMVITFAEEITARAGLMVSVTLPDGTVERVPAMASGAEFRVEVGTHVSAAGVYTVALPRAVEDLSGNARAPSAAIVSATYVEPFFSATVNDAQTIRVTFDAALSGTTAASEWTVGGVTPEAIGVGSAAPTAADAVLSGATTLTLSLAFGDSLASTSLTPTVSHARPAATAQDASPNVLRSAAGVEQGVAGATASVTPTDAAPPTVVGITFASLSTIVITFSEELAETSLPTTYAIEADGAPVPLHASTAPAYAALDSDGVPLSTVTITLAADATLDVEHEVTTPGTITDAATPANEHVGVTVRAQPKLVGDTSVPTFTAATALPNRIVITFSEAIVGTAVPSEWGVAGSVVTALREGSGDSIGPIPPLMPVLDSDGNVIIYDLETDSDGNVIRNPGPRLVAGNLVIDGVPQVTTITIELADDLAADATPSVTYTATSRTDRLSDTNVPTPNYVATATVTATDGIGDIPLALTALAIGFTDDDSSSLAGIARIVGTGDEITVTATFNAELTTAPKIGLFTAATTAVDMTQGADATVWSHTHTVAAANANGPLALWIYDSDDEEVATYMATTTGTGTPQERTDIAVTGLRDGAAVPGRVTIDTTAPARPTAALAELAPTADDPNTAADESVVSSTITLTFAEAMDPSTLTSANLPVSAEGPGGVAVTVDVASSEPEIGVSFGAGAAGPGGVPMLPPPSVPPVVPPMPPAPTPRPMTPTPSPDFVSPVLPLPPATTVIISLVGALIEGVTYTVAPSSDVTDLAGNAYAAGPARAGHAMPLDYTARLTSATTTVLTFDGELHSGITAATDLDEAKWLVEEIDPPGPATTASGADDRTVTATSLVIDALPTVTLTLANDAVDGVEYTINPLFVVTDAEGTEYANDFGKFPLPTPPVDGSITATYANPATSPPTFAAIFTDAFTITLTASEALDSDTVIAANFAVTAPDNTNTPDDADSNPDVIALATTDPVVYTPGSPSRVTINLAGSATDGVAYTITPSASVTDAASTQYAAGAMAVTYADASSSPPTFAPIFTGPRTLTLTPSEPLDIDRVLQRFFPVDAPDNTNTPHDADSAADEIDLAVRNEVSSPPVIPVVYVEGTMLTLTHAPVVSTEGTHVTYRPSSGGPATFDASGDPIASPDPTAAPGHDIVGDTGSALPTSTVIASKGMPPRLLSVTPISDFGTVFVFSEEISIVRDLRGVGTTDALLVSQLTPTGGFRGTSNVVMDDITGTSFVTSTVYGPENGVRIVNFYPDRLWLFDLPHVTGRVDTNDFYIGADSRSVEIVARDTSPGLRSAVGNALDGSQALLEVPSSGVPAAPSSGSGAFAAAASSNAQVVIAVFGDELDPISVIPAAFELLDPNGLPVAIESATLAGQSRVELGLAAALEDGAHTLRTLPAPPGPAMTIQVGELYDDLQSRPISTLATAETVARINGVTLVLPPALTMENLADIGVEDHRLFQMERITLEAAAPAYTAPSTNPTGADLAAAAALESMRVDRTVDSLTAVEFTPITLSKPVSVRISDTADGSHVFWLSGDNDRTVNAIEACAADATETTAPALSTTGDDCYVRAEGRPDIITLDTASPIAYSAGSPASITITLADDAEAGVAYTITPSPAITDAGSAPYAAGPITATYAAPATSGPILSAVFTDDDEITLTASEALDADTVIAANFEVTAPDGTNTPDDADSDADVIALATTDPVTNVPGSPPRVTITLAGDATEGVTYTITPSASLTDAASAAYAAGPITATHGSAPTLAATFTAADTIVLTASEALASSTINALSATVTAPDGTAAPDDDSDVIIWTRHLETFATAPAGDPVFEARTTSPTTTLVTFSAALSGAVDIDDWTITDEDDSDADTDEARAITSITLGTGAGAPEATSGSAHTIADGSEETTLLITHAAITTTDATPSIEYAPGTLAYESTVSATDIAVAPGTIEAADGIAPVPVSAAFVDSTHIDVTFSEAVIAAGTWQTTPILAGADGTDAISGIRAAAMGMMPNVIRLESVGAARPMTDYTVTVPPEVTDRATTPNRVDLSGGATVEATSPDAPFTAKATSLTTTVVTFGGDLAGTLDVDDWTVTFLPTDPVPAISSIATVTASPGDAVTATPSASVSIPSSPASTMVIITHEALSTPEARPHVAYAAGDLTEGATAVASGLAIATDSVPPTVASARTTSATTVEVTLAEDVTGTTAASEWAVGTAMASSVAAAGATVQGGALTITSAVDTITITLADDDAIGTGDTPDVAYTQPTGDGANELVDTDDSTVALGDGGGTQVSASDGAPPVITTAIFELPSIIDVLFSEPVTAPMEGWTVTTDAAGEADPVVSSAARGAEPNIVRLTLAEDAPYSVEFNIGAPAGILDEATGPGGRNAFVIPATAPTAMLIPDTTPAKATAITFVVHDDTPGTNTAKTGPFALFAGVGDTVRITVELNEPVVDSPTITVSGLTDEPMTRTRDGIDTEWHYDLAITGSTAETAALSFTMEATDRGLPAANTGEISISDAATHEGTLTIEQPTVDVTAPTLSAIDTSVRIEGQNSDAGLGTVAGIGDELRVSATASEPLNPTLDSVEFNQFTQDGDYADTVDDRGSNSYTWIRTVVPSDTGGSIDFLLVGQDRAGNESGIYTINDAASRVFLDVIVPTIQSARITSATTVEVTASERLSSFEFFNIPTTGWSLGPGLTVTGLDLRGASTVELTFSGGADTSITATLTYTEQDGIGVSDQARNELASTTTPLHVPDRARPTIDYGTFVSASVIDLTFSEHVTLGSEGSAGWSISPDLGALTVSRPSSMDLVRITTENPATHNADYVISAPDDIVDRAAAPNTIDAGETEMMTYVQYATYMARTQMAANAQPFIQIVFDEDVVGDTTASEWFVDVEADGTGGTAITQIHVICAEGGMPTQFMSVDVSDVCGTVPTPAGEERTLYLRYETNMDSGDTPRVAYRAPLGQGATPIVSASDPTVVARIGAVTAIDGISPVFAAATATSRSIEITFEEDVTGEPDASRWYHYEARAIPPSLAELEAAIDAETNFATATLDGRTLTLTLPDSYTPTSGWGSGSTTDVPDTIGYNVPEGMMPDILDASPQANGLQVNTVATPVAKGAPPEASALTVTTLAGGTTGTAKTDNALYARDGDAIQVSATLTEASSSSSPPTLAAFGSSATMTLSNSDMDAVGAVAIVAGTPEGPARFTITVSDTSTPENTGPITESRLQELRSPNVIIDNTAPELLALIRETDAMHLLFTERVHGSGTITYTNPSDGTMTGTTTYMIPAATPRTTITLSDVLAGDFEVTITGLIDRAGNAHTTEATMAQETVEDGAVTVTEFTVPPGDMFTIIAPPQPGSDVPGIETTLLLDLLTTPDDTLVGDLVVRIQNATVTFARDTGIVAYGTDNTDESILFSQVAAPEEGYMAAADDDDRIMRANADTAEALNEETPELVFELGQALSELGLGSERRSVLFDRAVSIRIHDAGDPAHIFWLSGDDELDVNAIESCSAAGFGSSPTLPVPVPGATGMPDEMLAECHVREGRDVVIYTNHFTRFGTGQQPAIRDSGGDCDDCTPPTLGIDSTGQRRVAGGFVYNGDVTDAEYYYTPLPLITVETGAENIATLKVFEDSGVYNVRHVGLGFGLTNGQHFAESEAEIHVNISFAGEPTITIDDPANAIDRETLRADVETGECMPGSAAECRIVHIYHTFREPLDFNVVSTIIWDDRRNAWQNFFNHGVHVTGESLNPSHGIEVNGGELVLYPLITSHVDDDGDGIFDYDERHVTYMLDEEYRVYRLTPDGTYQPARNLYSLHHEIDDEMYDDERMRSHGIDRSSSFFADELSRQEQIAREIMAELGVDITPKAMPEAVPSLYEGMVVEPRMVRLQAAIAAEINAAELQAQMLYR